MNEQTENPVNAVTIVDGFSDENDPSASPIKGTNIKFKDGNYFAYSDEVNVEGKSYAVLDRQKGWQKLAKGCQPEYLMQKHGEPKPEQPHVDKEDWPENFNGEPEHPWKWTHFVYLFDLATGELLTFWSSTTGGNMAVGELSDQVSFARTVQPGAIPIVALESKNMPTGYGGTKPRPHFHILGYRPRNSVGPQNLLSGPAQGEVEPITTKEALNDEIGF